MRIRNKDNGAIYESETMVKEGIYYVDRVVKIDDGEGRPIAFMVLKDGWEEVSDKKLKLNENETEN